MADPLSTATLATVVAALFWLLMRSKGNEAKAWKTAYKGAVASRRRIRRDVEESELGAPSVPPPPDEDYDDDTKRIEAIDREDAEWRPRKLRIEPGLPVSPPLEAFEDRLSPEERRENRVKREVRKYVEKDGESTPPKQYRGKLPTHRD